MHSTETTLQVYHRYFKIPIESYLNTVADFLDPWEERAYQHFVQNYLETTNDEGIVGMVRQEKDESFVYFDAAVRYPINHTQDCEIRE
ncbi:hypothetical protein REC12_24860 [Desulfosporosinus sp. PR]|uniref:hypothetical protein n=1 Tax=Candidatus Desulfosporosinus nitrosoreducens TaxID=3401928 RepID=UPI0027E704AF|nr:hypothetical protein [Desulfosporosinus sp. PR]MDQ7096829.1 hypothetical protein [Desulfosporosinus sp. PR]